MSIPCFAERRTGGVLDASADGGCPPTSALTRRHRHGGMRRTGFRYPFPQYGHSAEVRDGMGESVPGPQEPPALSKDEPPRTARDAKERRN